MASLCYLVRYPSGRTFTIRGHFVLAPLNSWLVPTIVDDDDKIMVLDQRAIVESDGVRVYSPRCNRDGLDPAVSQWLDANELWAK